MATTVTKLSGKKTGDLFRLGRLVMTPGAIRALSTPADPSKRAAAAKMDEHTRLTVASLVSASFLARHRSGDWGSVCPEDARENDRSVRDGDRILSAYQTGAGEKIYIITEWDRSLTTILLPDEY